MKKKISSLTLDELNRVAAVKRGWKIDSNGATAPDDYHDSLYMFETKNYLPHSVPNIAARPELWWPIAEENRISIDFSASPNLTKHDGWVSLKNNKADFSFDKSKVGEAVLRCWLTSEFGEEVELV